MSSHQEARTAAAEPLLPQQHGRPDAEDDAAGRRGGSTRWITALGFLLFLLNCGMAVYCPQGSCSAIFNSQLDLLALLVCLKRYEKAEPGSQLRDRLRVSVWLLTAALALLFSYLIATVTTPAVAVVVALIAVSTVAGGLYYLF